MQFKTVFAVLSIAAAATASPVLEARSSKQECGKGFKPKCCNSVQQQLIGLVTVPVGINCVDIINVGDGECSQTTACCQSGKQSGLVNIGNVCPIVL